MEFVIHRVNTIAELMSLDHALGVEVDIRSDGRKLVLNHEPFQGGERFADYLACYSHGLLVLNIKEAGIEDEVLRLVRARGVREFFLLDVEFPYIFKAIQRGERQIAVRFSEFESIETVRCLSGQLAWVWIDTVTRLPLDSHSVEVLRPFKTCVVCPERWGRKEDVTAYCSQMKRLGFQPDAIMTTIDTVRQWGLFASSRVCK